MEIERSFKREERRYLLRFKYLLPWSVFLLHKLGLQQINNNHVPLLRLNTKHKFMATKESMDPDADWYSEDDDDITLPEEKKNTMEEKPKIECEFCGSTDRVEKWPWKVVKFACIECIAEEERASGSVAAPKEEGCPKCGSDKVIMFTSDDDLCQSCGATFPGRSHGDFKDSKIKRLQSELASLRQQLADMNDVVKDLKKELAGVKKPGVETRPYKDYNEFDQEQRGWKPK